MLTGNFSWMVSICILGDALLDPLHHGDCATNTNQETGPLHMYLYIESLRRLNTFLFLLFTIPTPTLNGSTPAEAFDSMNPYEVGKLLMYTEQYLFQHLFSVEGLTPEI